MAGRNSDLLIIYEAVAVESMLYEEYTYTA
jgi:hypothetical protein